MGLAAMTQDFRRQIIVRATLPPCSSSLLQDVLCHAAFCIPKICAEIGHGECDREPFRSAALRMFLKTLYSGAVEYWARVFPNGAEDQADGKEVVGFKGTVLQWIRQHEVVQDDDQRILDSLSSLKKHLTDDDNLFYKLSYDDIHIPVLVQALLLIQRIYKWIHPRAEELSQTEVTTAFVSTMPNLVLEVYGNHFSQSKEDVCSLNLSDLATRFSNVADAMHRDNCWRESDRRMRKRARKVFGRGLLQNSEDKAATGDDGEQRREVSSVVNSSGQVQSDVIGQVEGEVVESDVCDGSSKPSANQSLSIVGATSIEACLHSASIIQSEDSGEKKNSSETNHGSSLVARSVG